ncbi:MAG: SDR family NAD(P)-dependent oxidoreductase [Prevotella sp.]|jgi:acyl transferase domain-containing protein/NAD(P)H-dependent flavin oxidoreductase YrpB (nitropropane dioxygenase family)/NAD(P)-dependent dehydrogenase (short-subunit alcohol dehydrogenase family)|nr:SDR family NAD(P)-dependent oxidoreductase [Prevotella sp.]
MQHYKELLILSPFEIPNATLALKTIESGAYPVLHLGRNESEAQEALDILAKSTTKPFGVCYVNETSTKLKLPLNVDVVIFPFGMDVPSGKKIKKFCQVHSLDEAESAIGQGLNNVVVKGNEGAGRVADQSSFVLFQSIISKCSGKDINVYVQGGTGIHTSAACLALGAKGIIMDTQVSLFPECGLAKELKNLFSKLSGSETTVIDNFRVLQRNDSPKLPANAKYSDILPLLGGLEIKNNFIPMGQDIAISIDLVEKYKNLSALVTGFHEAVYGHIQQAKKLQTIKSDSKLAKDLGTKYPIAQGPMARVSDVPEFACNVADAGALPFIAMSMTTGDAARNLVAESSRLLEGKTWGVGLLGFIPTKQREEQTKYILEYKPSVVLIAGGRPSLAKPFEKAGIKAFIHVPSQALLDMFLKENAKNFIFEGRESGGHIGPLSSFVLWERQIYRLLKEDNLSSFSVFFAGGIHDAFSSAFISIMSATLDAKGAKVGVLMGSSYLYTKEAVESRAILSGFQKLAIEENSTVILQAAPGQETQSLKSPFTEHFEKEKEKLQEQNLDSKEVWVRLEELNLGRSRIATKGIERIGTDLVKLGEEEQKEKGLYMIGQVAALNQKVLTLDELHKHVAIDNNELLSQLPDISLPVSQTEPLDVAIVGISGIFPDAHNIEEYWRNIVLGKDCISEVPDSRWNKDLYYDPNTTDTDKVVSKWGGFIPTIDFDPLEFGMTPQSLASIEPTQLLSLLVAKQALTDAGYGNLGEVDLENTSVIFGAEGSTELAASYGFRGYAKQALGELPDELKNSLPRLNEDSFAGVLSNVISGRIANRLNLGGRNYTVDAACASSLAALDLGCQELSSNRSDMVLLGGTDLHNGINDFLMFSCTHALSRKGYSASFDVDSDGIALGEGIGVLVMKRLADAERDGNKIYAVIKGVGGSSDGKSLGLTAPNRNGQIKALQRAYQSAGILPSQVEMIEAHGTGTVVGDRTELRALTDMFLESGAIKGQSLLGSVKTQIGHAKCAAGIAGVIKTALSIYYRVQPPTLHLNKPNPYYDKDSSPFVFNTHSGYWDSERRIAGVSAFGFGGTNFHVVMENHKNSEVPSCSLPLWPSELFVFRGDSLSEAKQQLQKVKDVLGYNDKINIKDIAYSLAVYSKKEIQLSIVASDSSELLKKIDTALAGKEEYGIYPKNAKDGKVAFMFSGQGSQRVNMARDMFVAFPAMRRLLAKHKEYEKILFPYATFDEQTRKEQQKVITDTRNAQPLLGIVDFAFAEFLKSLGIVPDMVAGHSYGELPALCFAGAFDAEELVSLSRKRALSILDAVEEDKGKMIAVSLPEAEVNALLEGETEVWAVNFNSHKQIVLAGSTEGVNAFMQKLSKKNIAYKELNVACAFHSPLLHKSKDLYADVLKTVDFKKLSLPVWSNTTAEYYPAKGQEIKDRLSEHLIKPVLFTKQVENMYNDGARVFLEVGPGRVLTGLVQSILGDKVSAFETENKSFNGVSFILHTIAKYLSTGKFVDIDKLFDKRNATIIDIDKPEQYKKSPIIWHVNGHNAVPANGKMPSTGAYPITQPIMNLKEMYNNPNNNSVSGPSSSDQVVLEYLNSMRMMLQSQRDVMLGYLGHTPANNISAPIQTIPVQQVLPVAPAPQVQQSQQQPVVMPAAALQPVASATPAVSIEDIKALLLETVSEKTGYPIDMLGLELDLEADLSIDSIKRMEVIGALREKLNISGSMEDAEDTIEKLASVKTLNGLIEWIEDLAKSSMSQAQPQMQSAAPVMQNSQSVNMPVAVQPVASPIASTPAPAAVSMEDIKALLLETVSEKTGYPIEMLGLELDLEADLSIDSIKRMEIIGSLREKLNISGSMEDAEDTIEKLASVKTLNGLIEWIEDLAKAGQEQASAPVQQQGATPVMQSTQSMPVAAQPVVAPAPAAVSMEDIKALLLETVSEKTGYPTDMLGLDLDLEADLSIDSIKRMEIIGSLRDKLNISGSIEDAEDTIEKLASVKTLNGLIDWIEELANGNKSEEIPAQLPSQSQPQQAAVTTSKTIADDLIRMSFELEEKILNSEKILIDGKHFALTDDGGEYAESIKAVMELNGATVDLIKGDEDLTQYDGLVILNSSASPRKYSIKEVFNMIKNVDLAKIKWVYTFSDILGNIKATEGISKMKEIQGFPGLIKSLAHEFPTINFRAVVSHSVFDKASLAQIVVDELLTRDATYIEIIYKDEKRYFTNPKPVELTPNGGSHLTLDKDSVVVVFGGAQGITPELVSELSKEYPCNYILVGRSEAPTPEFDKYKSLDSKDKIRKYLISEENMRSPGEIEKKVQKIFKANQINENVAKIEKTGGKVTYVSLDIKNEQALRDFIKKTYETYGRIDGIFHAAGLLDDKLFIHKTFDSFEQVYSTKVTPLHVLLDELRPDLKLFVMFSSVASSYGNKGQSDYASANSVFDHIASALNEKMDARILTINWGPWKGTGMVSDTLEAEFKKRGVSLIPLKEGAEYFVNELKYGKENHVLVMGGAEDVKGFLNI